MSVGIRHRRLTPYLFLAPALVVLTVFFLVPIAQVAYYSFTDINPFRPAKWVGVDNYARLLASSDFWQAMLNSAVYVLVTPVVIVLSLAAALVCTSGIWGSRSLRLLLFLPVVTPTIVGAVAWRVLLREEDGVLNWLLVGVGLDPIPWLTERPWTLVSPMLVTLWKGFGFFMMIFIAGLIAIPKDLKEAAHLDGATPRVVLTSVMLPALWPSIVLVGIVSSISALKVFDEIFVTVRGVPLDHQTAVPLIYDRMAWGEQAMASAAGVVLFVVILVLSLINLRLTRGGRAGDGSGGVRGEGAA